MWIPTTADERHELCRVLGAPAFRALVAHFGGTAFNDVPTDYFRDVIKRDRIVYRMVKAGNGAKAIAFTIGMTERQVQNIRMRLEEGGLLEPVIGG